MNNISEFLDKFTSEYNLEEITEKKALYIENNISKGGRVANFIVDKEDIIYYENILFNILFKDRSSIKINNITDLMKYINIIAEWVQLRLNTRFLFLNKDWDFFNKRYIEMCFGFTNFNEMNNKNKTDTNIRNLFFGDCREHEILVHILIKLFIDSFNLNDKYVIRRLDVTGITIGDKDKINDKSQYTQPHQWQDGNKIVGGTYYKQIIDQWEHTHSVLHDIKLDKLYSIDAIDYNTKWNPLTYPTHNIELQIVNLYPRKDSIPFVNYKNLIDKEYRTYIEIPAPYSNRQNKIITSSKNSKLFSSKFILDVKKLGNKKNIYKKYKIISIGELLNEDRNNSTLTNITSRLYNALFKNTVNSFDKTIKLLCIGTIHNLQQSRSKNLSKNLSKSPLNRVL
jgi:hypothetical protein